MRLTQKKQQKNHITQAPQNDCLNLSFVKDVHIVDKKMAGTDRKIGHLTLCFISKQSIVAVRDRRMALCIRVQKNPPRIKAQNLMLSR